jgi:glycosyltransferase involved in cell wall biosynthesis
MHVIDGLAVGGAERMLIDLVNSMDCEDHFPVVCITRSNHSLVGDIKPGIPIFTLDRRSRFDISGLIKLRQICGEQRIDLLHAHGLSTFSLLLFAKIFGFINNPIVVHDHSSLQGKKRFLWFRCFGAKYLDYYVGVYNETVEWAIENGVRPHNTKVIGNSIDFHRLENSSPVDLHSELCIPPAKKIGIFIGNIRPVKGLDILIRICAKLPREKSPVIAVLGNVSDPQYAQYCRELIKTNHLESNIRLIGQQSNSIDWIKGADFAVIPSRSESGPLVLIEYLACGIPFVAFKVGGVSRLICEKFPHNFSQPNDEEEFSTKLLELLDSKPSNTSELVIMEKFIAAEYFDIKNIMPQWYTIYQRVLGNKE